MGLQKRSGENLYSKTSYSIFLTAMEKKIARVDESEHLFALVCDNAKEIGMTMNQKKPQMHNYVERLLCRDVYRDTRKWDDKKPELKVVGFYFSDQPNVMLILQTLRENLDLEPG